MSQRAKSILKMLEADGDDEFLHYCLAMEYASCGRYERAVEEFTRCMELKADYLAAYVEAGKCLVRSGRLDEAREIFTRALALAEYQGDGHACDGIRVQLESLARR